LAATHAPLAKQTLFHDGFLEDPYPTYREFRDAGKIHELDWGGRNLWTVFCYDDCLAALKDQRISARRMAAFLASLPENERAQFSQLQHVMGLWLAFMDAPEHSRLRKLMNKGFSPAAVELLRPQVKAIMERMLNLMGNTSEVDLMPAIAHPLPVSVIAELLGLPDTMQTQLTEWSDAIAAFIGNPMRTIEQTAGAQEAIINLTSYFRQIVPERRLHKRDDLISLLLEIEADGETLTEDELYAQCIMLLFAGHETTRNLIGNGVYSLLCHPRELARLQDDPDLIRSSVEEMLRFDSPVQFLYRVAKEEVEICGVRIQPGNSVVIILGAANRDPHRFRDPDTFDLGRLNNPHLAFGGGPHFCIGNQLARLEGQVAILRIIARFPNIRLADRLPTRARNFSLRGFQSLPVLL
jgi:cytochrome P450